MNQYDPRRQPGMGESLASLISQLAPIKIAGVTVLTVGEQQAKLAEMLNKLMGPSIFRQDRVSISSFGMGERKSGKWFRGSFKKRGRFL